MFTKQHYESVARIFAAAHADSAIDDGARTVLHNLTQQFADYFGQDNELFARKAFIGACHAKSRSEIRRLVSASNATVKAGKRIEWKS